MDFSGSVLTKEEQADGLTPLIKAALVGCVAAVRELLAQGVEANARDKKGMTALMHGAKQERIEVVQALVENGVDVNLAVDKGSDAGCTALIMAVTASNEAIVRLLLDHGADANARTTRDRRTALIHTASNHYSPASTKVEIMELLLTHGADVNTKSKDRKTALLMAISRSTRPEAVQLLLNHGADVNAADSTGESALTAAAVNSDLEDVARMLLEHGANVNAVDKYGKTALMCAAWRGNSEIVRLLMEFGANVNAHSSVLNTALIQAANNDHDEIVRMLLECPDIDVNIRGGFEGATALMSAVAKGNTEVVRALLTIDAVVQSLDLCNRYKQTVFDIANASGDTEIVEMVTEARDKASESAPVDNSPPVEDECQLVELKETPDSKAADLSEECKALLWEAIREGNTGEVIKILLKHPKAIEVVDEFGNTPLHLAAIHSQNDIVGLLLLQGADVNATDMNDETPLMIATRSDQSISIVSSLLDSGANTNAARADGWTALMLASQGGHAEFVRLLLEQGADVAARSKDEMTAVSVAEQCGHGSVAEALQAELLV